MEIKDKKEYRDCLDIKEDIKSLIKSLDETESDVIKTTLDPDILKGWSDIIGRELDIYNDKLLNAFEGILVPGNIIKTATGDGISYSEISYYYIKIVRNRQGDYTLISDVIKISNGEFGNSIEKSEDEHVSIGELIEKLNKQYYTVVKDKTEYEKLDKFTKTIPELNWSGLINKK